MAKIMEMPKLSDTMTEGSVARWLKKEGEKVTSGSPIIEIETDKATMEFEAPASGTLLKILVGDGQRCPLQAPIAVIGKADESWQDALQAYQTKKSGDNQTSTETSSSKSTAASTSKPASAPAPTAAPSTAIKASPLAKKIAAEQGVDLASIQGSGPHGRIIQRDLLQAQPAAKAPAASTPTAFPTSGTTVLPVTNMRRTIAKRLTESVQTAPHFFLTISLNMAPLLAWRKAQLEKLGPGATKFSVNDMMIFFTARALKQHPLINASWQENEIIQYHDVHMSVAVALPAGLITPVVRNADKLGLLDIAQETKRLIDIAKSGKIQPADYTGGTFSISNLGMTGVEEFTAIINPPQAAILAVGSTVPTPVVNKEGQVVVEDRMKVTLSCDHRVIDGAAGAEFLKTLKRYIEDPLSAFFQLP